MMAANMVILGAFIGLAKPVKIESVKQAMLEVLPERHHKFIPINSAGLDRGEELTNKIAVM
jgi:2-oxoglutarate ferredoxin oxidoreductase subunit gamma